MKPVKIDTGSPDEEGRLAFAGDRLVAVLVLLSDEHAEAGKWFLEAGFGKLNVRPEPVFRDLAEASRWIEAQLKRALF
nr:hypothetical protein [Propylenella binzhouense]